MSTRLEEQIRRYTEHLDAVAPPVEALLPPDLRDETGRSHLGTVTVTIPARPEGVRNVPGWAAALAGATAVLVLAIPLLLWINTATTEVADTTVATDVTPTTAEPSTSTPDAVPTGTEMYPVVFDGNDHRLFGRGWEPGIEVVATLELDTGTEARSAIPDADGRFIMSPFDGCCSDRTVLTVTQGDRSIVSRIDRGIVIDLVDADRDLLTIAYGNGLDVTLIVEGASEPFTTTVTPDSDWWSIDLSGDVDIVAGTTVTAIIERNGVAFAHVASAGTRNVGLELDLTRQQVEGRGFFPNTQLVATINGAGLPGGLTTDAGGHFVVDLLGRGARVAPGDTLTLGQPGDALEMTIPDLAFDNFDPYSSSARGRADGTDNLAEVGILVEEADGVRTRVDTVGDVQVQDGSWTVQLQPLAGGDSVEDGWIVVQSSFLAVRQHLDTSDSRRPALPFAGLDLPGGNLHGAGFPVASSVLVSFDGGSSWDEAGRTSVEGRFEFPGYITGPAGTELVVDVGGVTASTILPDVTITDIDTILDSVAGTIDLTPTANCCINVFVFTDSADSNAEQFPLTIRDDGTWYSDLGDRFDITRNSRIGVDYQDPNGISIQWDYDAISAGSTTR